jgi:urea transporter
MEGRLVNVLAPWNHLAQENVVVGFVDTLLRGTGQVMFQNNPITGLLFLIGIFYNSYQFGIAAVIGLLASTITAMLLGADRNLIRAGLFGFNGVLTGIALVFFLRLDWSPSLIVYIILGGVFSAVVFAAIANFFSTWDTPALTAPFVLTAWLLLFAALLSTHLLIGNLINPALLKPNAAILTVLRPSPLNTIGGGATVVNLLQAFFRGIGEVFFQNDRHSGQFPHIGALRCAWIDCRDAHGAIASWRRWQRGLQWALWLQCCALRHSCWWRVLRDQLEVWHLCGVVHDSGHGGVRFSLHPLIPIRHAGLNGSICPRHLAILVVKGRLPRPAAGTISRGRLSRANPAGTA